jgi:hypothetical protein
LKRCPGAARGHATRGVQAVAELGRIHDVDQDHRYLTAAHHATFRTKILERSLMPKGCYACMTNEAEGCKKTGKNVPKGTCNMLGAGGPWLRGDND